MPRYLLFVLFSLLMSRMAAAQAFPGAIDGAVRDSLKSTMLEEATVNLLVVNGGRSRVFAVRRNGPHGFQFRGLAAGEYLLVSTYLGYSPDTVRVVVGRGDKATAHVVLRMQRSDNAMMQVVVTARIPPAIVRHDTIAFNSAAYPTQPHATLEDLLRKLPGIDIDKDGNVTMQGKKVDRIYLDGKEFFLSDPKTATQNLPADIIDQVEAFDSQSDQARLTGVRDMSGTRTINIKLKKSKRRGYFGKLYAGTGSGATGTPGSLTGSYSAGGNGMVFGNTTALVSANLNNLNDQFTGRDNRNGPGNAGVQTLNKADLNIRRQTGRLSYSVDGGTNGSHTLLDQLNTTQTSLTDSSLLSHRHSHSVATNQDWQGNLFLEYRADSFRLLELRSSVSGTSNTTRSTDSTNVATLKASGGYPVNDGFTSNTGHTTGTTVTNLLNFRQRWRKPGRTLYIGLSQNSNRQDQPQTTYSRVNQYDSAGALLGRTVIDQAVRQQAGTDGYGGQLIYTEPLRTGHLLDWSYKIDRTVTTSDRASMDFDSLTGAYDKPDAVTSNHFTTTNTIQRAGMGYNGTIGKCQYQIGLAGQFSELDNRNRSNDSVLRLRQTNWFPRASLIYSA
ncbi:MAG TPA: TonB-dependent receptor, partial [Puia sp.]|nr:TonB-dependent receptor [Puia sp.]